MDYRRLAKLANAGVKIQLDEFRLATLVSNYKLDAHVIKQFNEATRKSISEIDGAIAEIVGF